MTLPRWTKQPLTRAVATGMRAATKGKDLDGHTFRFTDLKELWLSEDERYVIATHDADPLWQLWECSASGDWSCTSLHRTREEAVATALDHHPEPQPSTGTYVVARMGEAGREIRTACLTADSPQRLMKMWEDLGYQVWVEEVGEAVNLAS